MADPVSAIIMAGLGIGSGLASFIGPDPKAWQQNALVNILNNMAAGNEYGLNRFGETYFPLREQMFGSNNYGQGLLFGNESWGQPGMIDYLAASRDASTPDAIKQLYSQYGNWWNPQIDQAIQGQQGIGSQIGGLGSTAGQVYQGGGWTPGWQQIQDALGPMMTGQTNAQNVLTGPGFNLLDSRGQTGLTNELTQGGIDAVNTQGMNPALMQGQNIALGVLGGAGYTPGLSNLTQYGQNAAGGAFGVGGLTPTGAMGEAVGLEGLLAGGANPTTQALQALGLSRAAEDAVMSPDQAAGFAEDQAVNAIQQQGEAARRRAFARGGGPGSVVDAGVQNADMMDFADQAARLRADAVGKALLNQQGLSLQQQQQGAQMAQAGMGGEQARLGTFGNLLGNMEGVAAGRFGTGLSTMSDAERIAAERMGQAYGAIPGMQNAGTNALSTLLQSALGAGNLETSRMGLGGDLMQQYLQSQLGAINAGTQAQQGLNQYALGSGGLAGNLLGQQASLYNNIPNWLFQGGTLGLQQANQMAGNIQAGAQQQGKLADFYNNLYTQAWPGLTSLAGQGINYAQTGLGGMTGIFSGYQPGENPWAKIGQGAAGGLKGIWDSFTAPKP